MGRISAALLAAAGAVAALAQSPEEIDREFANFQRNFGKRYADERERAARFDAFAANYRLVQEVNGKKLGFQLAINRFADMTAEEFGLTHLGLSSSGEDRWGGLPRLGMHQPRNATLPSAVDWRSKGAVTPVKNQAQCGSCWAFSTTGSLEGAWQIASGHLLSLSEQQLVDCSSSFGNQGCGGGLMDNAFKYAESAAMCTEDSYPYEAKNGVCRATGCTQGIPQGGVVGFKDVAKADTQALMDAVAQQPVSVAIEADRAIFQLYSGGVISGICGTTLDHGVLVVGYGTEDGKDYWLVKNSWGAGWGEQGYVKLLRGKSGVGECGIKSDASYPVVKASEGFMSI
jgi:hypothetical protein